MKRRFPDPDQPYDHLGNPEDGEVRYIEVETDVSYISPRQAAWIARKRRERKFGLFELPKASKAPKTRGVRWSAEQIIEAIKEWAALYGEPPRSEDWNPRAAVRRGSPNAVACRERWEAGEWPSEWAVYRRFGSWSAAIKAAGFVPPSRGKPNHLRAA